MNDFSMLFLTAVMIKSFDVLAHSLTVLSLYLYFIDTVKFNRQLASYLYLYFILYFILYRWTGN